MRIMDKEFYRGMSVGLVFTLIAAILVAFTVIPVAAAVTVDGQISPADEWDNPLIWINDTADEIGTAPPGYNIAQVRVKLEDDTLYFIYYLFGVAGDADNDGDPDTACNGTDWPGIGAGATSNNENYRIAISDSSSEYYLRYILNSTRLTEPYAITDLGADTNGAYGGNIVEMSLANASDWINLDELCVLAKADTDTMGAEDYAGPVCVPRDEEVPVFTPLGLLGLVTVLSGLGLLRITTRKRR